MSTKDHRSKRIEKLQYEYDAKRKIRLQKCNVCGSERQYQITHKDRYGYNASTFACEDCSLTYLNPRMTAEGYEEFYETIYRPLVSAYHDRTIDAESIQGEQAEYADMIVDLISPLMASKGYQTLLDVGGSTGIIAAKVASEFGLKATVIDPAPDEVEKSAALGIESVVSLIEDWDPQGRKFDLVGMFQTIDHLLDARLTFEKLRAIIADEGMLVVDIVDFRNAYLRNWSVNEGTKIDHPYYFTENSVETLLRRTGFRTLQKVVCPDHLHILYICKPSEVDSKYLPQQSEVTDYLKEIRYVQSTPWKRK